jgi:PAS domain S-box-containing protein
MPLKDLYAEAPDSLRNLPAYIAAGTPWQGMLTFKRQDESTFRGQMVSVLVQDKQGNPQAFGAIIRDLSPHLHLKSRLYHHQALLQSILEHSPAAIYIKDMQGRYLFINQHIASVMQCPAEQVVGKTDYDLFPPETVAVWREQDQEVITQGTSITREQINFHNDEPRIYIESKFPIYNETGVLEAIGGIATDITARTQAEKALRESRNLLQLMLDHSPASIFVRNLEGRYLLVNRYLAQLLGKEQEQIVGKLVTNLFPPDIARMLRDHDQAAVAASQPIEREETIIKPDGSAATFLAIKFPLYDNSGAVYAVAGISTDITTRKQAEEVLRRSHTDLEHLVQERTAQLAQTNQILQAEVTHHEQMAEALRVSEERYRIISELVSDFAYAYQIEPDGSFTVEWITDAAARITGFTNEEIEQQGGWFRIVHPDDMAVVQRSSERVQAGYADTSEFRIIARNGQVRWLQSQVQPVWDEHQGRVTRFYGAARDITERREAEEHIRRHVQYLSALRQIDMAIIASLDLRLTLNILLEHATFHLKVNAAAVLLLDTQTQTLTHLVDWGIGSTLIQNTSVRLGEGFAGWIALERRPLNTAMIGNGVVPCERAARLQQEEGFTTYYGIPLIAKGYVKGVLECYNRAPIVPDPEWLNFLDTLAGQTAIAIDNAELFESLQRANDTLTQAYNATIEGWAHALEMRDADTEGHTRRVTEVTLKLAASMGMSDMEQVHMYRGAILHDIGKMAIPDHILLKEGPLTDEEWDSMRQHPVYAHRLLSNIPFLRPALDIPYCHHEKWDGSGYPRGLKQEQIPLAARIFAVVDVWDALRSDRPYRPAWTEERVLAYISEQAGSHFDPQVVTAFLQLLREQHVS